MKRCWWGEGDALYQAYHDNEWGRPLHDDRRLFEMLSLELFQSGLSWLTILRKRENFARAFSDWQIPAIAAYGESDVRRLMGDAGIVRNLKKIEAVITNARRVESIVAESGSLNTYFWGFAPVRRQVPAGGFTRETLPLLIDEAKVMSKALKKAGFSFTGPMTCMSLMQAVGMVNDHVQGCDLCIY